jgi:hypothetical protein
MGVPSAVGLVLVIGVPTAVGLVLVMGVPSAVGLVLVIGVPTAVGLATVGLVLPLPSAVGLHGSRHAALPGLDITHSHHSTLSRHMGLPHLAKFPNTAVGLVTPHAALPGLVMPHSPHLEKSRHGTVPRLHGTRPTVGLVLPVPGLPWDSYSHSRDSHCDATPGLPLVLPLPRHSRVSSSRTLLT